MSQYEIEIKDDKVIITSELFSYDYTEAQLVGAIKSLKKRLDLFELALKRLVESKQDAEIKP